MQVTSSLVRFTILDLPPLVINSNDGDVDGGKVVVAVETENQN